MMKQNLSSVIAQLKRSQADQQERLDKQQQKLDAHDTELQVAKTRLGEIERKLPKLAGVP